MLPKIKSLQTREDYLLEVVFDDGKKVLYDVKEDMKQIPSYVDLKEIPGLFSCVKVDESRTCISWTEDIDLPSDTIYEYGAPVV